MALYTKVLADEASIGLPSSLTLGRRADVYLRSGELDLCMSDCAAALAVNPDSAKTLRTRGRAKMLLGEFDGSLKDLVKGHDQYSDDHLEIIEATAFVQVSEAKRSEAKRLWRLWRL